MKYIDREENKIISLALKNHVAEGGTVLCDDERSFIVLRGNTVKCAFDGVDGLKEFLCGEGQNKLVCVYGMPLDLPIRLGIDADACATYAYIEPLPPALDGSVDVRRLAPSLADVVAERYSNKSGAFPKEYVAELMRERGIFGAIVNGALAGFIGRHDDGDMGMLNVDDRFRRRGIGEYLQKFLINYVMTFFRTPVCDVYTDNAPSLKLQEKIGMTRARDYTFWIDGSAE